MSTLYMLRAKPSRAPPAYAFGIARGVLYPIIIAVLGVVVYMFVKKRISFKVVLPFLLNLIFNLIYTPLQFNLQNMTLATIDIFLVEATIIRSMIVIRKHHKFLTVAQVPYLLRVSFACVLQVSIYLMNG